MSKTVNKLYKHNATIYKVILFLITAVAIVYLFPKGGQFKYEFTKGKPWQYDNLYAPFDFAIDKSEEEITEEIKNIEVAAKYGFSREDQDAYAIQSYQRSAEAWSAGKFSDEIIPVEIPYVH